MIYILAIAISVLIVYGIYLILVGFFKLPIRIKSIPKAVISNKNVNKKSFINGYIDFVALKAVPYIRLNKLQRTELETLLNDTGISPELHIAKISVTSITVAIIGLLSLTLNTYIGIILLIYSLYMYNKLNKKAMQSYTRKRKLLEAELPRFVAFIEQKINFGDTNVIDILNEYRMTDNELFSLEIEKTITDMQTSSYEHGLLSFNKRINSGLLSMVIRGLIALVRGEEQGFYFKMLKKDFNIMENNELKMKSERKTKKIDRYNGLLILSLIIILMTPLVITIYESFIKMFS